MQANMSAVFYLLSGLFCGIHYYFEQRILKECKIKQQRLKMLHGKCKRSFFLSVIAFLQIVFSNQAFAPRPSRAGTATPKPQNFAQWLKSSFLVLSCGTRMSCGDMSKSKVLESFLGFGVSYIHWMTPNEVEPASVASFSPLLLDRVRFFVPVQGRSPTPVLPLRKVCKADRSSAIDKPDSPITLEEQRQRWVVYAAITQNYSSGFLLSMNYSIPSSSCFFVFLFYISRLFIWMPTVPFSPEQKQPSHWKDTEGIYSDLKRHHQGCWITLSGHGIWANIIEQLPVECTTQLNGGWLEISKGWQSLLLKRAKCVDNWKLLFVPVVDTAWSTVFVTKGDANDVQSELILADCLFMIWLFT